MNAAKDAVVGRPPYGAWDGLAAAPQLLLIEAFTAEAHVMATLARDASRIRQVVAHMNLLKRLRALAITAPVFVAGCADVTSPEQRLQIPIDGISVPSTAAPTDTVVIGFRYEASCGEREVTLRLKPDSLVVSVVAVYPSAGLVCPGMAAFVYRTVSLTPAERALPFTAVFSQPIGADSVRVIHVAPALMDAP